MHRRQQMKESIAEETSFVKKVNEWFFLQEQLAVLTMFMKYRMKFTKENQEKGVKSHLFWADIYVALGLELFLSQRDLHMVEGDIGMANYFQ